MDNKVSITDVKSVLKEIREIHNISTNALDNLHNLTQNTINHAIDKAEYFEGATKMKLFQPKTSTTFASSTSSLSSASSEPASADSPSLNKNKKINNLAKKVPPDMCAYCAKKGHWVRRLSPS
ncbi:hypothetical protein RCL_jg4991.t1 [Rhizophagus clarus]|uniref:Uncharacterized protein n=1 Tax=Rhizophagus clarus TaxID=94130 RepID=A0A8H3LB16_9GLOM|nr:hypothetical protein RCL_jg4991.t1 [Rhizophagus clarus]